MRPNVTTRTRILALLAMLLLVVAAGCGDDSDSDSGSDSDTADTEAPSDADDSSDGIEPGGDDAGDGSGDASSGGGAGGGTLTMDGEEIALSSRCFLEEQDAAAGGGTIELTGQGSGTNAAGDEVLIDFTRFSEESDFAGDDVSITVGDPFSGNATEWGGVEPIGTVGLDGSTLSATDFPVSNFDTGTQTDMNISFSMSC